MSKIVTIGAVTVLAAFVFFIMKPVVCLSDEISKREIPVTSPATSPEALTLFQNGREAFEIGRIQDANLLFDKVILKDPQFALAHLYKAYIANSELEWKRNIDLAIQYRQYVSEGEKMLIDIESSKSDPNQRTRLALAKHLVELFPLSPRALLILADEYRVRKDFAKFRNLVHDATLLNPELPLGYKTLALSYLFHEPLDFLFAQKYMQKLVEIRPNEPMTFIALGDAQRAQLNLDQARVSYGKAIKLDPDCDVAYAKRGYINAYLGCLNDARSDWQMAGKLSKKQSNERNSRDQSGLSYMYSVNGKFIPGESIVVGDINMGKKTINHPLEAPEMDHYFCCTVISMLHGVYVSPFGKISGCRALQREFSIESKAPDNILCDANLTFIESIHALQMNDFELSAQKAKEYSIRIDPDKNPQKPEVFNYLMGLINLKQEHYGKAVECYLKSDLNNACVKYELGLAYDGLGKWDKAREMFNSVSNCKFTGTSASHMSEISNKWLTAYASVLKDE